MRTLAGRHSAKNSPVIIDSRTLIGKLMARETNSPGSIAVVVSNVPGRAVAVTRELLLEVDAQQELYPDVKEPVT
jgi:hypothetical protein